MLAGWGLVFKAIMHHAIPGFRATDIVFLLYRHPVVPPFIYSIDGSFVLEGWFDLWQPLSQRVP